MITNKPNIRVYRVAQFLSEIIAKTIFKRKYIRNEIKDAKGPMVIVCNHQAALDFTTLIGATKETQTFVVSDSFYQTLPFKKGMDKICVIPKQQFQTSIKEIALMRKAVKQDGILTFYPAGLMCEDGLSTPIPDSTYAFLKWLDTDVYAARVYGTYFCTPKWSKKIRTGKTFLDIYKIIDQQELCEMTVEQIKEKIDNALLFDAYREQERLKIKYSNGNNIEGLENVLYICPHCKKEYTLKVKNKHTIYCTECGFAHKSDKYGFLHNVGKTPEEMRYVSDWSLWIQEIIKDQIEKGELTDLSAKAKIQTIDPKKHKYTTVGYANIKLTPEKFIIDGPINCKRVHLEIPTIQFASLPFKPGYQIEIQHNKVSYRCILDDGKLAMKFVDMLEVYYKMRK